MRDDDKPAFLALFLKHQRELCAFALARGIPPADVDDVMQDAAIVLWEKFASYAPGTNFRAWAFQVLRFVILRKREAVARHRKVLRLDDQTDQALCQIEAADDPDLDVPVDALHRCLGKLGARSRELLHLRYQDGLSPAAIAERLGVSAGSLRVRLHRLRQQLLACIGNQEGRQHP